MSRPIDMPGARERAPSPLAAAILIFTLSAVAAAALIFRAEQRGWSDPLGLSFKAALGLLFSLMLAYTAKLVVELRMHERGLEALVAERTAELEARGAELHRAQPVGRFGSWMFDLARNEILPSRETCRILVLPEDKPLAHEAFRDRVHASDRDVVDRAWQAMLEGERYDIEHRIVVGDSTLWVHSQAEPLFAEDGTLRGCVGTTQDITERKRTEGSLRLFRSLVDHSTDAIEVIDPETGRFLDVNEKGCQDLGYSREELLALSIFDIDPGIDQALLKRTTEELRKSGSLLWKGLHQRKDGSTFPVEVNLGHVELDKSYIVSVARDITERVNAEQDLRDSELRFRTLIEKAPIAIAITRGGAGIYANAASLGLFGLASVEAFNARPIAELFAPQSREASIERTRRRSLGLSVPAEFEAVGLRGDGSQFPTHVTVAEIEFADGWSRVAFIQDITERKRAGEALRESEERFRTLIERAPVAVGMSRNGLIVYVNRKYLEMYGYQSVDELRGQPVAGLLAPQSRAKIEESIRQRSLGLPVPNEYEAIGQRRDGSHFPVHARVTLVQLADGVANMAFLTDVTERRRAEEALRLRDNALEASANAIVITDADGRIEWCNHAFTSLTGYAVEEVIGENPRILKSGVQDTSFYEDLWRTITSGGAWHGEVVNRRRDGTLYPEEMTITPVLDAESGSRHFIAVKQDITQRKRAEESLLESEERFRTLIERAPLAIGLARNGRTIYVNSRYLEMYGFQDIEELRGRSIGEQWAPQSRSKVEGFARNRALGLPVPNEYEGMGQRKDGSQFPVHSSVAMVQLPDGPCTMGFLTDISNRKEMEDAINAEKEFTDAAINAMTGLFGVRNAEGRLLRWNRSLESAMARRSLDVARDDPFELIHPDDRRTVDLKIAEAMEHGSTEVEARALAGSPPELRHYLLNGRRMEIGGRAYLVVTGIDTTERRRAEEERERLQIAVSRSADEWRKTFDTVNTPILITERDGIVVRLNRAARDLSALSYEKVVGKNVAEIAPSEPWQTAAQLVQYIDGKRSGTSAEARDNDGRTWDITVQQLFTPEVADQRFILVLWEITGIVELQESLRRSETMSAMGTLVAGVAHEVRNPLFGISSTLDAYHEEFSRPGYVECATALRSEVDRLVQLMRELLEYGKPAALHIETGRIDTVTREAVESRRSAALSAGVRIRDRVPADLPPLLMDQSRLRQVFENLIDNAVQHSPRGSEVVVEGEIVEHAGRQWIECRVEDRGTGFAREDLDRVFEPFFTRRPGGTGLGLSIVQRIVEEHSGKVSAANRSGGGGSIRVRFPIMDENPVAGGKDRSTRDVLGPEARG
jgi:PAS domain S-box-containing protein